MNPQVVNNQHDFPVRIIHESPHEINETLLGHVFPIAHEAAFSIAAYRRNHVYLLDFRKGRDDGCPALGGDPPDVILLIVYAGLVSPVYIGILCLVCCDDAPGCIFRNAQYLAYLFCLVPILIEIYYLSFYGFSCFRADLDKVYPDIHENHYITQIKS